MCPAWKVSTGCHNLQPTKTNHIMMWPCNQTQQGGACCCVRFRIVSHGACLPKKKGGAWCCLLFPRGLPATAPAPTKKKTTKKQKQLPPRPPHKNKKTHTHAQPTKRKKVESEAAEAEAQRLHVAGPAANGPIRAQPRMAQLLPGGGGGRWLEPTLAIQDLCLWLWHKKRESPKWLALGSGNMDQNLRFAPPV